MADFPLLIFAEPARANRSRRGGGSRPMSLPNGRRQAERIRPQFNELLNAMRRQQMAMQGNPYGIVPEQVLVIEIAGSVGDFVNAVRRVEGLEWLAESAVDEIEPSFGFEDAEDADRPLNGQLFLIMTNQVALGQLLGLFQIWVADQDASFPYGLAKWKTVFAQLRTIRNWNVMDRTSMTGVLRDWMDRLRAGLVDTVPFEAELWFRRSSNRRRQAAQHIRQIIESSGGSIVQQCVISEIGYHAILGRMPASDVEQIVENPEVRLLQCEEVMFFRPVGQCSAYSPEDAEVECRVPLSSHAGDNDGSADLPKGDPVVALLDGLPLDRHQVLDGRLLLDDPDDYTSNYQVHERKHGTAMASVICHGDLSETNVAVTKPLYVRPIMQPARSFDGRSIEVIPDGVLPIDVVHRAVRRMFVSEGGEPPSASKVRIISLSVCDRSRPFAGAMSSWGRLLDWLACEYNVLFIVSAGNHTHDVVLNVPRASIRSKSSASIERSTIRSIAGDTRNRSLLAPAETLNGITVSAAHSDASTARLPSHQIDPLAHTPGLPSVISAHGPGYRRSIKPDVLLAGGRQVLAEKIGNASARAVYEIPETIMPPGQLVAWPSDEVAVLDRRVYARGTSNAAALASRYGAFIYDMIEELRSVHGQSVPEQFETVLIKAILVHGAGWESSFVRFQSVLMNSNNRRMFRDYVSRFIGYGYADVAKATTCTAQRVTALGFGDIRDGDAHEYSLPLPPSLAATTEWRRLTITLSWLTPVNIGNQKYRIGHLWFSPSNNDVASDRMYSDWRAVQRGTLQHEVFEGSDAVAFGDGENIVVKINCRSDASDIIAPVHYGLAVTLEVAQGVSLPIYQEVRDRLAVRVAV